LGTLDDNVGNQKGLPRVCLGRSLARLVHGTLRDEQGHDLVDQLGEDAEEDVHAEHLVPEAALGVFAVDERKPNEECL